MRIFIKHTPVLLLLLLWIFPSRAIASDPDASLPRGSGYRVVAPENLSFFEELFPETPPVRPLESFDVKVAAWRAECESGRDEARIVYDTDNTFITLRTIDGSGAHFNLAHVLVRDPSQICICQSNDTFGGPQETPTNLAQRTGAALVVNGSYFSYSTGTPFQAVCPVVLRDGAVMRDGTSNGSEICLRFDGSFFSPHPAVPFTAQDLLNLGVISSIGTADPLLIADGDPMDFPAGVSGRAYPRTAIGMVIPGEYYFLVAGSKSYAGGLTYRQMQAIFFRLGCTYARSMDGGGSSSLVIDGALINTPAAGTERAVADFIAVLDEPAALTAYEGSADLFP